MRKILASVLTIFSVFVIPAAASAHIVVKPVEVGIGAFQTFTTSVPNEKEVPVTALRLVLPDGLKEVAPTVKTGWDVTTKKSGGDVTEINWNSGTIPAGMRDDFTFSAQAHAQTATLQWKAYQTYEDGTIVSWDQTPTNGTHDDSSNKGPYSTTKVVNDLGNAGSGKATTKSSTPAGAYVLSGAALALAIIALISKRK